MASNIISSCGTNAVATGSPQSPNLIFDGTNYWCFYGASTQSGFLCYRTTTNLSAWGSQSTVAATNFPTDARLFTTIFRSSNNVVLIAWEDTTNTELWYLRGAISGTSISWGSISVLSTASAYSISCLSGMLTSAGVPLVISIRNNGFDLSYVATSALTSSFADTSWSSNTGIVNTNNFSVSGTIMPLASSNAVMIADDFSGSTIILFYRVLTSGTWGSQTTLWSGTGASSSLWAACQISTSNTVVLGVSATSTFSFSKYDGSSWSSLTAPSWPSNGLSATSSLTLQTDGTKFYAFIVGNDANDTVQSNTYSGTTWGGWTNLETSAKVRSYIQSGPYVSSASAVDLIWTQTNGANYEIWTSTLSLAAPQDPVFPVLMCMSMP